MDHVTSMDLIYIVLATAAVLIRNRSTKSSETSVKTEVQNKGNETQIKIDDASERLSLRVGSLALDVRDLQRKDSEMSSKLSERLDRIDASLKVYAYNLHKVCVRSGVEWVDEVTILEANKKVKKD